MRQADKVIAAYQQRRECSRNTELAVLPSYRENEDEPTRGSLGSFSGDAQFAMRLRGSLPCRQPLISRRDVPSYAPAPDALDCS